MLTVAIFTIVKILRQSGCWGHETYSLLTGALRPVKMHPDNHLVRVPMGGYTTLWHMLVWGENQQSVVEGETFELGFKG